MTNLELDDARYEHHLIHRGQDNKHLVQNIWTVICTVLASGALVRCAVLWKRRRNREQPSHLPHSHVTGFLGQTDALLRALSLFSYRNVSVVRLAILLLYAATASTLLFCVDAPALSTHFIDDIAFRAAWITLAQVPLVYLLSTKCGPLNILIGLSYERINWIHRWTGRVLFVCATTHMLIMMSSISIGDLLKSSDAAMAVVRYGAATYGTLTWIAGTSIFPVRRWSYRFFQLNHWVCTIALLLFLAKHVPSYARLPVYASVAILATENSFVAFRFLSNNITVRIQENKDSRRSDEQGRPVLAMGHAVKMMTPVNINSSNRPVESSVILRIPNVPFTWRPGQHVKLYIPRLGALEIHPFTPATCSDISSRPFPVTKDDDVEHWGLLSHKSVNPANDMLFMIKTHAGMTRRLADYYSSWLALPCPNASGPSSSLTAYISGPYGNPPHWEVFDNIVLVATSTGVTHLLSILDYLEQLCFEGKSRLRTQRIKFVWTNRHLEPQLEAVVMDMFQRYTSMLRDSDIEVDAQFYFTCEETSEHIAPHGLDEHDPFAHLRQPRKQYFAKRQPLRIINPNAPTQEQQEEQSDAVDDGPSSKRTVPDPEATSCRSSCDTYVSSTLIDDESERSEWELTDEELETSWWSRVQSLLQPRARTVEAAAGCLCAQVCHEQRTRERKSRPPYVSWTYGRRPDIASILSASLPATEAKRGMVVVCSNRMVVSDAKSTVSRMNMELASGRRKGRVEIHMEGFG